MGNEPKKITVPYIREAPARGDRLAMITAYDYPSARLADAAGADIVLVGDSLAMVVLGHSDTLSVTMDEMLHHVRAVRRGLARALLVADMPFGSFHLGPDQAVANAIRFVKEGGAQAVKIEGARIDVLAALVDAEIPVMGHIGLTPQSIHRFGGFKVQGRGAEARAAVVDAARAVEAAGAFSLVLECIPTELGREVTEAVTIPTIGIGAGPHCDGQVLVWHDLLGIEERIAPRFVRRYAQLGTAIARSRGRLCERRQERRLPLARRELRGSERAEAAGARATLRRMITLKSERELRHAVAKWRSEGARIGFVPTMGALHAGHLSLLRIARQHASRVVVSIFVNPTQFGPNEDLDKYPRTPEQDAARLAEAGCDLLFLPEVETIYPPGAATRVRVDGPSERFEGEFRPGHFEGVATVVAGLFGLVRPDVAVFGEKDAQQLAVVRALVRDLHLGLEILAGPTVREDDGLAMSSRNVFLDPAQRRAATVLHRALEVARALIEAGERSAGKVVAALRRVVAEEPTVELQYAAVVAADSFRPLEHLNGEVVVPVAARVGTIRLLDNIRLRVD